MPASKSRYRARPSVTIREVARLAQVHPGTVSRALNEQTRGLVNEDTAARVLAAAEQLGYRPNPIARGLKTNRSFTVGVLVPDLTNPVFPPMVRGIEDRLTQDGYTPLIVNSDNDAGRERNLVKALRARQVDGFISATARLDHELSANDALSGLPLVLINRSFEDASVPAVTIDDERGIHLAVEHVVSLGHRRIGHVGGPQNLSTGHRRYAGFLWAMEELGLEVDRRHLSFGNAFVDEQGQLACAQVLAHGPPVTAIVAANDRLAIGCYDALREAGLRCPEDVSIVGFNDMPFVDRLQPPLTSVRVPGRELGMVAAELLLDQLRGEAVARQEIMLEPTLVVRGSTAPPPGA